MMAALLGGAIVALGQAPFSVVWLALLGVFSGFVMFQSTTSTKQAAWVGWAFGVGYFGVVLSWIVEPFLVDIARHGWMAPFALIGMAGGMALFWGLAFGLARWQGRAIALVVFWTGAEVLRTYILTGFPWGLLGYIWLDAGIDQMAAFIGPHGLTLITLGGVWALLMALEHPRRLVLVPAVVTPYVVMIVLGSSLVRFTGLQTAIAADYAELPIIRLVQPNAPQHQKWDPEFAPLFFERSLDFTAAPATRAPDVIIWPETSMPYLLNNADGAFAAVSEAAGDIPVVLGVQRRSEDRYYNSMVVLGADGAVNHIYDKSHLVPFGEYVPGGRLASALGLTGFAAQEGFGFSSGAALRLLNISGLGRALPLICYEAIFPQEIGSVDPRADWLLQITNDAWFGNLTGPQQHLAQARFRAIEQGLPMARAANTGISGVIDARGVVTASLPLGVSGYLDVALPGRLPETIYAKSGDWPVLLLLIAVCLGLLAKRRRVKD